MQLPLMLPITEIAARLGLSDDLLEPYGRAIAKIRLEVLERFPKRRGKLILVTAITPTTSGCWNWWSLARMYW